MTAGRATTFKPESQIDPNLNVNVPPELTNAKWGAMKHQPNLYSLQSPAEPRPKQRDKPSQSHNPFTKRKQVAQLVGKKCLVWFKLNNVKVDALWDTGA